jgi:hypothetical protein
MSSVENPPQGTPENLKPAKPQIDADERGKKDEPAASPDWPEMMVRTEAQEWITGKELEEKVEEDQ